MKREFKVVDTTEIESNEQGYVYNNSRMGVCFEIEKGECESGRTRNTQRAQNTDGQTGRKENIQTRHKLIETGKQIRNVREGDRGYYW